MAKVIELGDLETDFSKLKPNKSKSKSKTKSEKSSERKKKKSSSSSKSKTDKDSKKKSKKKSKSKDIVTKSEVEKKKKAKKERRGKSLKERAADKAKGELVHNDAAVMEQHLDSFVEANPYVKEHEQFQQYRNMFDKLSNMASPFEKQSMEGNQRAVYALMKIYDQMREVIADIRSLKDVQQMAQVLKDEVLSPLVKANVAELISFYQSVEQHARKTLPEEMILPFVKKLEEHTRNTANGIQENFGNAIFRLEEVLEEQ